MFAQLVTILPVWREYLCIPNGKHHPAPPDEPQRGIRKGNASNSRRRDAEAELSPTCYPACSTHVRSASHDTTSVARVFMYTQRKAPSSTTRRAATWNPQGQRKQQQEARCRGRAESGWD
ncbi:hypothetical protein RRG08_039768 [Elysia crispata]|uniref:Uncharacterized protein n=1 Tax=Elysia crispata TaxID=231223 RepID=A0AAE0ZU37_9GAST|nr:hypothetical protein RRG08_039768 [Elysia crispata]